MSKRSLILGITAALALAACDDDEATLVIANRSDFVIEAVHIAQVNDPNWGPNLLPDVLFPGEDLVVFDINCDTYDMLVVDEFGAACELTGIRLCDDTTFVFDNVSLDVCAFAPPRSRPQDATPQVSEPEARI